MKKTTLLSILLILSIVLLGQSKVQVFDLKSRFTNTMKEDSKGNLWFYSDTRFLPGALVKYNGSDFEINPTFRRKPYVLNIVEDSNSDMFFSNWAEEMARYNGKEYKAIHEDFGIDYKRIGNVFIDSKNRFWIFPITGLVSSTIGEIKEGKYNENNEISNVRVISTVFEDKAGTIWAGSVFKGLYKCESDKWEKVSDDIVCEIKEAKDGTKWFTSVEGKILKYNGSNFTKYQYGSGYFYWTAAAPAFILGILPAVVWGYVAPDAESYAEIEIDKNDQVWALIHKKGIVVLDDDEFVAAETKYSIPSTKKATSLFKDSEGNIWISTRDNGILVYNGKEFTVYSKSDGVPSKLYGVSVDSKGNVWAMGKNMIVKLNP